MIYLIFSLMGLAAAVAIFGWIDMNRQIKKIVDLLD
jgi:hypothetical protein